MYTDIILQLKIMSVVPLGLLPKQVDTMIAFALLLGTMIFSGLSYNLTQYFQTDYILIQERAEIVNYDNAYIGNPVMKNFKFNRTHFAMNISMAFRVDLNYSMMVNVQGYKFASNEYRLFPMFFDYNFCEAMFMNSFGFQSVYRCGKMFICPIKKGSYSLCNWVPDYTKFPPYIPRGRYMIDIKWSYLDSEIIHAQWYVTIKDVDLF